jgi:hypothetical protein
MEWRRGGDQLREVKGVDGLHVWDWLDEGIYMHQHLQYTRHEI